MPESFSQAQVDRAIDRAVNGVERLIDAKLETLRVELRGLRDQLHGQAGLADRVAAHETRLSATEAFIVSQQRRRGWRRDHLPSLLFGLAGTLLGVGGLLNALHIF